MQTGCSDIGKKPADLASSGKATPLITLIDVNSNTAAMAKRIADDVAGVIGDVTSTAPDLIITGYSRCQRPACIKLCYRCQATSRLSRQLLSFLPHCQNFNDLASQKRS